MDRMGYCLGLDHRVPGTSQLSFWVFKLEQVYKDFMP